MAAWDAVEVIVVGGHQVLGQKTAWTMINAHLRMAALVDQAIAIVGMNLMKQQMTGHLVLSEAVVAKQ